MNAHIMGEFPATVKRDKTYFMMRKTYLDCRGPLTVHAESHWGFGVTVLTLSHNIEKGVCGEPSTSKLIGPLTKRPVVVKRHAWIGSKALLYNCIIGEGAVVAIGTVVRSCEVAPRTMVAGNPAEVIARWVDGDGWVYRQEKWKVLS